MHATGAEEESAADGGVMRDMVGRRSGVVATGRGWLLSQVAAVVMLLCDVVMLELCVLVGLWGRDLMSERFPINLGPATFHGIYLAVLAIPLGCLWWRLYPGYGLSSVDRLRRRTLVVLVGFGLMAVYDHLAQNGQWSRGVLLIALMFALLCLPFSYLLARAVLARVGCWGERIVLLGPEERRRQLRAILQAQPELGWIPAQEGDWPPRADHSWDDVEMALLAPPEGGLNLAAITDALPFHRFVILPDLGGRSFGVMAHETAFGLGLEMRNNLLYPVNGMIKRGLDLLGSVLALPFALPLIAVFAMAVKIASPGPAFYGQWREGKDGRLFRLWKIRSMVPNAEKRLGDLVGEGGAFTDEWRDKMKLSNDPRVIPGVGAFIRRFSIDELPQLINVLLGDMSLVGPRPLPAYHLAEIAPALVDLRRKVRPGITGWAQVSGRSLMAVEQQVELDNYYIRNWSFWIDLYVVGRTAGVVVTARGAF